VTSYFIFKKHSKCLKHNSTVCGCLLNMTKEELNLSIRNSINLYIVCSSYFKISDKKVVYIGTATKIKYLNYSYKNINI